MDYNVIFLAHAETMNWFVGGKFLRRNISAGTKPLEDGRVLDEIIDQKITNNDSFRMKELGRLLQIKTQLLKKTLLRFNEQKIEALATPSEKVKNRKGKYWTRYKTFITNGGDPLPVQPELLFKAFFPKTKRDNALVKLTRAWSGNCRIPVCAVAAAEVPPPDAPGEKAGRPRQLGVHSAQLQAEEAGGRQQEAATAPRLLAAGGVPSRAFGSAGHQPQRMAAITSSANSGLPIHLATSPLTVIHHCTARRHSLHTASSIASKLMIEVLLFVGPTHNANPV
jgi:hypothetical protein